MDQIRIGKFIARTRKENHLTQRQLADCLSISDKTVSKWECGKGLPEASLMLPLCEVLHITVNDLLTGERVSEVDYRKQAEENMMNLVQENEENRRHLVLSLICGGVTIGDGCVIGAGSVVVKDIPAGCFAAGNPARVIREITEKDSMKYKPEILADNEVIE